MGPEVIVLVVRAKSTIGTGGILGFETRGHHVGAIRHMHASYSTFLRHTYSTSRTYMRHTARACV